MKNAQLWKRILNEGIYNWGISAIADSMQQYATRIATAPIIVDSRPCDDMANAGKPVNFAQFKDIAVPFPTFWVEQGLKDSTMISGVLFDGTIGELGWTGEVVIFTTDANCPAAFQGKRNFRIDLEGGAGGADDRQFMCPGFLGEEAGKWCASVCATTLLATMETLELLSCKNVSLAPHEGDPKQVSRAIKRHGGTPDSYRYHTLVVRPPGAKSDSPRQDIGIMPRHVCRGHFSEYGPQFGKGLLFGKYEGRFYVPPHLKGDKKNGIVEKDYEIPATTV